VFKVTNRIAGHGHGPVGAESQSGQPAVNIEGRSRRLDGPGACCSVFEIVGEATGRIKTREAFWLRRFLRRQRERFS